MKVIDGFGQVEMISGPIEQFEPADYILQADPIFFCPARMVGPDRIIDLEQELDRKSVV